jgi:hypothetical protein
VFHKYLEDENINHVYSHKGSLNKVSLAENAIRRLKQGLGRAMADNRTDALGKAKNVVYALNNSAYSVTRPVGISASDLLIPAELRTRPGAPSESCAVLLERTLLHYTRYMEAKNQNAIVKGQTVKFKVGDRVRIVVKSKDAFGKISDPQFSSQSYTIDAVKPTAPLASYMLSVQTGDKIKIDLRGSYSESQLKLDRSTPL